MPELFGISLHEQIAEVERELAMRKRVYARDIAAKRVSRSTADRRLDTMEAVLTTLKMVSERGPSVANQR
jgi:hypothetical protein